MVMWTVSKEVWAWARTVREGRKLFSAEASTSINSLVCPVGLVQLTVAWVGLVALRTRTVGAEYKTFACA